MAKSGQAHVPTAAEKRYLYDVIKEHRHPEKNTAIMKISFNLGLRVQEIALLQLKEVCRLGRVTVLVPREFTLHRIMALPAAYTKGANSMGRSQSKYKRKRVSFSVDEFEQILNQVETLVKAGAEIIPSSFYKPVIKHKGKSRDLPMKNASLRKALEDYITLRLESDRGAKPTDPLFITQKGVPYSPNTLQEHMALMLRGWAGIEKSSSHSGRRALITNIIHTQKKSVKIAQKVSGHMNPSTTIIYEEPPEEEIENALENIE